MQIATTAPDEPETTLPRQLDWLSDRWRILLRGDVSAPRWSDALSVALLLALSWLATFALGGNGSVAPHFFYVPILLAAALFGYSGALAAAFASGVWPGL